MTKKRYQISVTTCAESGVLVGTSPDIPGLTLEAESRDQLLAAVSDVVPQLLTHNLKLPENQLAECVVEVIFTNPSADPSPYRLAMRGSGLREPAYPPPILS